MINIKLRRMIISDYKCGLSMIEISQKYKIKYGKVYYVISVYNTKKLY